MHRTSVTLAALLVAGAMAPASAFAWPLGNTLHLHPNEVANAPNSITVHLYNQAVFFRDVKIEGHTYTVLPHQGIAVTAPAGTQIFAGSTGLNYHMGDLLLTVGPENRDKTVRLN